MAVIGGNVPGIGPEDEFHVCVAGSHHGTWCEPRLVPIQEAPDGDPESPYARVFDIYLEC